MAPYSLFSPNLMGQPQRSSSLLQSLLQGDDGGGPGNLMSLLGQGTQAPAAPEQGWGDRVKSRLNDLLDPSVALPMAGAMIAGESPEESFGNAFMIGGKGLGEMRGERRAEAEKMKALDYLRTTNPELAQMVDSGMPLEAAWGAALKKKGGDSGTDDMREYEAAKAQGFKGSFMDYQIAMKQAGRTEVNIGTEGKLPTNYRWKNPDDQSAGVEPIPGGPGEQLPAELAARVGLADSFLTQLPIIKAKVKSGSTTGVWDRFQAGNNQSSDAAETMRQIKSGTDALQRMLTGAGMSIPEAQQYAERYLPTYTDDAASAASKLDQLGMELKTMKEKAMLGRGGDGSPAPIAQPGSAPYGGTTSGGVKWSVGP
jgi:hypothetical protein